MFLVGRGGGEEGRKRGVSRGRRRGWYQPRKRTFDPAGACGREERKVRVLGRGEELMSEGVGWSGQGYID